MTPFFPGKKSPDPVFFRPKKVMTPCFFKERKILTPLPYRGIKVLTPFFLAEKKSWPCFFSPKKSPDPVFFHRKKVLTPLFVYVKSTVLYMLQNIERSLKTSLSFKKQRDLKMSIRNCQKRSFLEVFRRFTKIFNEDLPFSYFSNKIYTSGDHAVKTALPIGAQYVPKLTFFKT